MEKKIKWIMIPDEGEFDDMLLTIETYLDLQPPEAYCEKLQSNIYGFYIMPIMIDRIPEDIYNGYNLYDFDEIYNRELE